jgi:hypothetical protein
MAARSARRTEGDAAEHSGRDAGHDSGLRRLVDEERADDGARQRRDRLWLSRVEQETMTLPGLLVAMGERREGVRLVLRSGATRIGRVTAVGTDVVAITETSGNDVLISLPQIVTVRTIGSAGGSRLIAVDTEPVAAILRDQLLALTEERADVRLVLDTGAAESGTIEACGVGVVALRTRSREIVYVAEANIAEIVRATS